MSRIGPKRVERTSRSMLGGPGHPLFVCHIGNVEGKAYPVFQSDAYAYPDEKPIV